MASQLCVPGCAGMRVLIRHGVKSVECVESVVGAIGIIGV